VGLPAGGDYVYFGCDDGLIYAVNADTGQLRDGWPVATGGAVRAAPVVDAENRVLIIGSGDGKVYVLAIGP
jgi:outer membrane protein assembly factor BamB